MGERSKIRNDANSTTLIRKCNEQIILGMNLYVVYEHCVGIVNGLISAYAVYILNDE